MPLANWPLTLPTGETLTPAAMGLAIVQKCEQRLANPTLPVNVRLLYRLILAHAQLDSMNMAHGLLRTLVDSTGAGVGGDPTLAQAWEETKLCYDRVVGIVNPTTADLDVALNGDGVTQGIDHGGAG
jgi:hypothetical protein